MTDCKTCSKCGEVKAVAEFRLHRASCKKCALAYEVAYRKANHEKEAARHAAYRKANHEKVAASQAARRKASHEKVLASQAAYRKANHEKVLARNAAYRKANPKKVAASQAAYRKAIPEKISADNKLYASEMRPSYIAGVIGIKVAQLPPELLALKREQLATHRLPKQITQAIKAQGAPA